MLAFHLYKEGVLLYLVDEKGRAIHLIFVNLNSQKMSKLKFETESMLNTKDRAHSGKSYWL